MESQLTAKSQSNATDIKQEHDSEIIAQIDPSDTDLKDLRAQVNTWGPKPYVSQPKPDIKAKLDLINEQNLNSLKLRHKNDPLKELCISLIDLGGPPKTLTNKEGLTLDIENQCF